jgi:hypothetical protein
VAEREFVSLESATATRAGAGGAPCQGLYHRPAGARPTTAFVATHYNVDFAEHYLAPFLADRGFGFLGWNTRFRGAEPYFLLEPALVDIGAGITWLRATAGIDTVVLLGNSGGGSLMAAYQSRASRSSRGGPPTGEAPSGGAGGQAQLPPGDLYVSLNAHPGRPEVLTAWMDPSVADEVDPLSRDPALDMYDPAHGPPYTPAFVEEYRRAQTERNERITAWALGELDRLEGAGVRDRLFAVHRVWADLRFADLTIDPSDRRPGCYMGDPARANAGPLGIGRVNTLRTWLSMWSLSHSQCRGAPHLAELRLPALVVQSLSDRGVFPSDAHAIHDAIASDDKHLELVPGGHYLRSPDGARDDVADLIAAWVTERAGLGELLA